MKKSDLYFIDLLDALAEGFALQTFFIPILRMNSNKQKHKKLLTITYIIGTFIYIYVSYMGSYSILNRKPQNENP